MRKYSLALVLFGWAAIAGADELRIADGSSSGIYQQVTKEIAQICGSAVTVTEVPGSGAIENLDKLLGNEVNAAFMHADVLFYRSRIDDLSSLKTLLALFPEDVHFVAMNRPYKSGSWTELAQSGRNLSAITDLNGLPVGAAGGGYITANVIRLQGEIPYTVVRFESGKDVLTALLDGKIAAAVFVGAAPLPNLKDLGPDYKLLEIGESTAERLKSVYRRSTVTYIKMHPSPVPTVAADCLLVTRDYKTPKIVQSLKAFRQAVYSHIDELKETPGYHKAWQKVDLQNHGKWEWYNPR